MSPDLDLIFICEIYVTFSWLRHFFPLPFNRGLQLLVYTLIMEGTYPYLFMLWKESLNNNGNLRYMTCYFYLVHFLRKKITWANCKGQVRHWSVFTCFYFSVIVTLTYNKVNFTNDLEKELTLREYIEKQVEELALKLLNDKSLLVSEIWPEQVCILLFKIYCTFFNINLYRF
jgi:hypothetical protein